jgi:hypothetical protein
MYRIYRVCNWFGELSEAYIEDLQGLYLVREVLLYLEYL